MEKGEGIDVLKIFLPIKQPYLVGIVAQENLLLLIIFS